MQKLLLALMCFMISVSFSDAQTISATALKNAAVGAFGKYQPTGASTATPGYGIPLKVGSDGGILPSSDPLPPAVATMTPTPTLTWNATTTPTQPPTATPTPTATLQTFAVLDVPKYKSGTFIFQPTPGDNAYVTVGTTMNRTAYNITYGGLGGSVTLITRGLIEAGAWPRSYFTVNSTATNSTGNTSIPISVWGITIGTAVTPTPGAAVTFSYVTWDE
jgi:hypothetical protein